MPVDEAVQEFDKEERILLESRAVESSERETEAHSAGGKEQYTLGLILALHSSASISGWCCSI